MISGVTKYGVRFCWIAKRICWPSGWRRNDLKIAEGLKRRRSAIADLPGVAYAFGASETPADDALALPSYEQVQQDKVAFAVAERLV
ncbi:MAG: hypothetical protein U5K37_05275 [Natrialbaceae archaeon]|nr:hypothetical protein [Natrialbaceae archaeon]